ncbi:TetR/AcrR family transcriptional regulator [Streptomyces plumbiresistens]|uniref:TetR/AcrR family transcriptional regulator n=1 Tax=Streptomyces plumbiresistens TaxID=511811 RepID=A0ABP7TF07_9ACTN
MRREEILSAALDLFGQRGYGSVGIRDVAAASDLSATGIYRHFASKEDLLVGLFDRLSDRMTAAMDVASRIGDPGRALAHLVTFHAEMVVREPAMIPIYQREEHSLPPAERDRFNGVLRDYLAMWVARLVELDAGLPGAVARTTVVAAFGTLNGISLHKSDLAAQDLQDLAVRLAWRTLGPTGAVPMPRPRRNGSDEPVDG